MPRWDNYITPTEKLCKGCDKLLPISSFNALARKRKNGETAYRPLCIICEAAYQKVYHRLKKGEKKAIRVSSLDDITRYIRVPNLGGEKWLPIEGFEDSYMVSNLGRVKSLYKTVLYHTGEIHKMPESLLSPNVTQKGYLKVTLVIDRKNKPFFVHRLVAKAFIPNPLDLPEVNHKEGDAADNRVWKLEWNTHQENCEHRSKVLKRNNFKGEKNSVSKWIEVVHPNGETKKIKGVANAARKLNIGESRIRHILRGRINNSTGYNFKFLN